MTQRPRRLLYLEDDPLGVELLRSLLSEDALGSDLIWARSREEFEAALAAERFDAVVADYAVPGLGGLAALEATRRISVDMPFVVFSDALGDEATIAILRSGATDVVAKDRPKQLIETLRRALKDAEFKRAARERDQWYRTIVETAHEGLVTIDERARITFANRRATEMLGETSEQLQGRPMADFLDAAGRAEFELRLAARRAGKSEVYELRLVPKQRPPLWVLVSGSPIWDESGRFLGSLGMLTDITTLVEARQELEESRAFLERAQEAARIGSWTSDLALGRLRWSAEVYRIFGILPGMPVAFERYLELIDPQDKETVLRLRQEELLGGEPRPLEFRIIRADGERRWLRQLAKVVRDEAGRPVRLIGVIQDVTDQKLGETRLKETEERLHQSQKMEAIGRLAGGVAHDFNNLLTAIIALAELTIAELAADSPSRLDIEEIRTTGLRAAKLTQQLLAFSRRQLIEPRRVDVNQVAADLQKMLARIIGEDIALDVRTQGSSNVAWVDQGQIEQVLLNLAVNARDAMPRGGRLEISVEPIEVDQELARRQPGAPLGPCVAIRVADTGTGIDAETQKHLFEPFFTTRKGTGTGLGLATCYGIVKQHGGFIAVESRVGKGTVFTVYLPRLEGPPAPVKKKEGERIEGGTETILIVEDEPPVRQLMIRLLSQRGYKVQAAADGREALAAVDADRSCQLKLAIIDAVLPEMGGGSLAQAIQRVRPDLKVLFTSGYTDDVIVRQGLAVGQANFLAKPFATKELLYKVRQTLDSASA